ncbi:MAG: elongation factor P maturation arginine rhamnosyltransferase EarP [Gammaproteobacteria bacterium]|nr:elongation factor P maturation arginine rhamnosyltransferase EarP [Gammaproteobacteria bacterium]
MTLHCAIYCTVIDNFGDVGVCWRLARQLADEYHVQVTLWIDDLVSFSKLAPSLNSNLNEQVLDQITVCLWHKDKRDELSPTHQTTLDIIIEGFGCRLPDFVLYKMAQQAKTGKPPLWLNLEYLSAESWAVDCHAMPSIHPQTGLTQYFWFPSFNEKSGGLLREADLIKRRNEFQHNAEAHQEFWSMLKITNAHLFERKISLFSYENKEIHNLLEALAADSQKTLLLVPDGKALVDVSAWSKQSLKQGDYLTKDTLTIVVLPFLSHENYDRLLWSCDLNFVRGEDSVIRAQWAGQPFIWHIYPQDENAHLIKLQAFIDIVATANMNTSWQTMMLAWNTPNHAHSWSKALSHLADWKIMSREWQTYLTTQQSLTTKLMQFYQLKHSLSDE